MIEKAKSTAQRFCRKMGITTDREDYEQEAILYVLEHQGTHRAGCHLFDYYRRQNGVFKSGKYTYNTTTDLEAIDNNISHSCNGTSNRTAAKDLTSKAIGNVILRDRTTRSGISPTQDRNKAIMIEYLSSDMPMWVIGLNHGLSESRISQIVKQVRTETVKQVEKLNSLPVVAETIKASAEPA